MTARQFSELTVKSKVPSQNSCSQTLLETKETIGVNTDDVKDEYDVDDVATSPNTGDSGYSDKNGMVSSPDTRPGTRPDTSPDTRPMSSAESSSVMSPVQYNRRFLRTAVGNRRFVKYLQMFYKNSFI